VSIVHQYVLDPADDGYQQAGRPLLLDDLLATAPSIR
jgi:hypothetical protein